MDKPTQQAAPIPANVPFTPIAPQDAVTTRPPAAKGDDDLMSQPVKPS